LQAGKPLKQLHDGWRSGHPTMIQTRRRRSNQPADEHLISHVSACPHLPARSAYIATLPSLNVVSVLLQFSGIFFVCDRLGDEI
ncbi:hypothetical protein, partial [Plantactinospora sp. B24E8]|uniref:hypothetical protein n=1 Tax=Plantactinospora sp. B24E8 TaxID=3153567 RepID=UPI00325CEFCA